MIGNDDLMNRFNYHPPKDEKTKQLHEDVRYRCGSVALWADANVPDGREKSLAITYLEMAMMWLNAALARRKEA